MKYKKLSFNHVGLRFNSLSIGLGLGFRKKTNNFWALEDVSFELESGDVVGVIGKNGAGKSTIMSLAAGITEPSKGSVKSDFVSPLLLSLKSGFMQNLSGRKNIFLIGLLLGYKKAFIREVEDEIIEYSGLSNFIDRPVATYSTGMKARLGFAICVFLDSELLLVDEVLGVGDQDFKNKSKKTLEKMITNSSAIIVSHNQSTLKDLCSKCLIVDKGRSVFFGNVEDGLKFYSEL